MYEFINKILSSPSAKRSNIDLADIKALHSFERGSLDEVETYEFQLTLNKLLCLNFQTKSAQYSRQIDYLPKITEIAFTNKLFEWLDLQLISDEYLDSSFPDIWKKKIDSHFPCPHLLFTLLAEKSSIDDLKAFIAHDAAVHVPFHDVLAFMQIGTRGKEKVEFLENFSDEVGGHDGHDDHLQIFDEMLNSLNITPLSDEDISWQALACANTLMALSINRNLYFEAIGYLGCLETLTPARFNKVLQATRRLGIADSNCRFYIEHAECDLEHAEGWITEILIPAANQSIEAKYKITKGLEYRLFISKLFWDHIAEQLFPTPG